MRSFSPLNTDCWRFRVQLQNEESLRFRLPFAIGWGDVSEDTHRTGTSIHYLCNNDFEDLGRIVNLIGLSWWTKDRIGECAGIQRTAPECRPSLTTNAIELIYDGAACSVTVESVASIRQFLSVALL